MSRYVFNQYYFDLLKKLKNLSKGSVSGHGRDRDRSTRSELVNGIIVRKAIKSNYSSYDKLSDEYSVYFAEITCTLKVPWFENGSGQIQDVTNSSLYQDGLAWLQSDAVKSIELYKGITIGAADAVLKNKKSLLHYIVLFSLFSQQPAMTEEVVSALLNRLKNMKTVTDFTAFHEELDTEFDSTYTKSCVMFLVSLQNSRTEDSAAIQEDDSPLKDLESTSLGKLAKEIMSDIDVTEIHKSMSEEGDILKALSNPEGGMSKLLGTVSQKMIAKLASGEIRQDTLLQDALQFSTKLKDMLPKEAQGLGDIGNMMSQMGNLSKMMGAMGSDGVDSDGFDMSKISEMFGMKGAGAAQNGSGRDTSRAAKAKQMRRKLEKRKASAATAPPESF